MAIRGPVALRAGGYPHTQDEEQTQPQLSLACVIIGADGRGLTTRIPRRHTQAMAPLDLTVGQRATRSITLTADHVARYAEISGDYNPLHFDDRFVATTPFKRPVVQGGLTTGLLHALVAMDMPGPGTVFLSQHWNFTAPVFIGDTITALVEVLSVHASKPVTQLRVKVTRQDGAVVLEGEAWCYRFIPEDTGLD